MLQSQQLWPKAADAGCSQDQIGVLSWADFNCPWARTKENSQSILRGMASLNEANPAGTAGLLIQPDSARDSSLRGLYDEERQLFDSLFSMSQSCETRFVEVFSRESKKAESKSNARKFGSGRLVTSSSLMDSNGWLASELAVYGRFVGANESSDSVAPLAILPKTASLLIPEPASPDPMIVSTACFDWVATSFAPSGLYSYSTRRVSVVSINSQYIGCSNRCWCLEQSRTLCALQTGSDHLMNRWRRRRV